MRVRVGCQFDFEASGSVPSVMLVRVRPDQHRVLYESNWVMPEIPVREYVDTFGNANWRFTAPEGHLTVRYDALVELERVADPVYPLLPLVPVEELPDETLLFTLPSRFIQSDELVGRAWDLFGTTPSTWQRVQAICDWVHTNVRYETGASSPTGTALDVLANQVGVCRDFALLAVAFCRAMNIPARYTFGYLPDIDVDPPDVPMDFHAWFEAFVGGRWFAFDARHNIPRVGRVVVGRGRDAADVAMTTSYGSLALRTMTVWADEVAIDDPQRLLLAEEDADTQERNEALSRERSADSAMNAA